ncbi:MAG: hypothetical protein U9O94_06780, partial [Nanoarchaeota archaeon]|nr:hypothetical protein [Nanoarchaeota archaeon]
LAEVKKTLSTPTYVEGAIITRENLSGFVDRLAFKQTPVRDRLPRKQGSGLAASWNVMTAIGVGTSPFAEGATPNEDNTTYDRRSAIYKELGKKKSITDRMLAAGRSFMDQEAEQTEVAIREVIQDEEQLIITGNATSSVLQFDGLSAYITTNITNDNNNALGFRTDLLDAEIANIVNTYGVVPTAIYCSYGMKRAINQSLAGDVRVNINQGSTDGLSTGLDVNFYQSMVGKLPIIPTFAISDDTVTYAGNTVSDIYVVTEKAMGQDVLFLEDLYPLGKSMLDRTGAAINFMVTEATVLVCRAEEFQTRLRNVRIS